MLAGDDVGAAVIDCGSWVVRVGSSGDDVPRALVPPVIGLPNENGMDATMATAGRTGESTSPVAEGAAVSESRKADAGAQKASSIKRIAGDKVLLAPTSFPDVSSVYDYDVTTGTATVRDWDAMQAVWEAGGSTCGISFGDAPLLVVEPTRQWSNADRAKAVERAFEGCGVPAMFMARGAAMAAFASVRTTACVVDIGHQGATAVPVVEGYTLQKKTVRSRIGGQYLSDAVYATVDDQLRGDGPLDGEKKDTRTPIGSATARLRALHEVKRQLRISPSTDTKGRANRFDVEDLTKTEPQSAFSDSHRAFYRMRLLDDVKASTFRTSSSNDPPARSSNGTNEAAGDKNVAMDVDNGAGSGTSAVATDGPKDSDATAANDTKEGKEVDREKEREREIEKSKEKERRPSSSTEYELPDGNIIDVGKGTREAVANVMFENGMVGETAVRAISNMAFDAISACDVDVRRELYGGIVLTGGCSLIPGTIERFTRELAFLTPQMFKMKILAAQNSTQRLSGPWIGGSILSSLGTFQQTWISRAEYDELGAEGSLRKCP